MIFKDIQQLDLTDGSFSFSYTSNTEKLLQVYLPSKSLIEYFA